LTPEIRANEYDEEPEYAAKTPDASKAIPKDADALTRLTIKFMFLAGETDGLAQHARVAGTF
jgi:hypothetical protein